jgi:Xaa-Pro aminopeptidase
MDALDTVTRKHGATAYVVFGSSADPDMRYLTGFRTNDPVIYFKKLGERGVLIVPQMEYEHALRESVAVPLTRTAAGLPEILKNEKDPWKALAKMIHGQVAGTLLVPPRFPLALAEALREYSSVVVDEGTIEALRSVKHEEELEKIRAVQRAAEQGMEIAVSLIRRSKAKKGILHLKGKPLTSERVKSGIHKQLMDYGCRGFDTIVSCGDDTAIPHVEGSGPLQAESPIILDIFPQDEHTGYVADMTRTVSKGVPEEKIKGMYEAVRAAQDLAVGMIAPGKTGAEIYQAVVDLFHDQGYESTTRGFIHNLGHGVGLAVHELPSLGPGGGELAAGNVITVEPGLYYPGVGGVRLEDMGVVTAKGFERFTTYPRELVV